MEKPEVEYVPATRYSEAAVRLNIPKGASFASLLIPLSALKARDGAVTDSRESMLLAFMNHRFKILADNAIAVEKLAPGEGLTLTG